MSKDKGVLIIVTGGFYYEQLAINLALSIRNSSTIPIALASTTSILNRVREKARSIFSCFVTLPSKFTTNGTIDYAYVKLNLPSITPFSSTLYLDADCIWIPSKNPKDLFTDKFQIENNGFFCLKNKTLSYNSNYPLWYKVEDAISSYKLTQGKLYKVQSQIIFFRKKEDSLLFRKAKSIYRKPKISITKWGHKYPDEPCLGLSMALLGYEVVSPWKPIYWEKIDGPLPFDLVREKYYAISLGGLTVTDLTRKYYYRILSYIRRKSGFNFVFSLQKKVRQ